MAKIARFQFPDGKIGKFEVPDDYTPEQAQSEIEANVYGKPQEQIQQPSNENRLYGLGGRAAIEGVAGIPAGVYNFASTVSHLPDIVRGKQIPETNEWGVPSSINTQQYGTKLADYFGLPQPTEAEQKPMEYARLGMGTLAGGGLVKALGGAIPAGVKVIAGANAPVVNTMGALGGKAGSEYAGQVFDKSPSWQKTTAQIAGGVLGGGLTSGISSMVQPTTRAVGRLGNLAVDNLEGVAGRALNRGAGNEASTVADLLEQGQIYGALPVEGYKPTSSQIAGNPGISALARQVINKNADATGINARSLENTQALDKYVENLVGPKAEEDLLKTESFGKRLAKEYTAPMSERNLPVDISGLKNEIDKQLASYKGRKQITAGLMEVKSRLPEDADTLGFNEAYNIKKDIDEILRGKYNINNASESSIKNAGIALKGFKKSLSDALTATEPEFASVIQQQAIGLKHQKQSKTAQNLLLSSKNTVPLVRNIPGTTVQETITPYNATALARKLTGEDKNEKLISNLSDYALAKIKNLSDLNLASTRVRSGMAQGSNTVQNANLDQMLMDDISRALSGSDKASYGGKVTGIMKMLDKPLAGLTGRTDELTAILAKAELDPAYAAKLMKKYKLSGPVDMSTPAGRAALYGALTQYQNSNR